MSATPLPPSRSSTLAKTSRTVFQFISIYPFISHWRCYVIAHSAHSRIIICGLATHNVTLSPAPKQTARNHHASSTASTRLAIAFLAHAHNAPLPNSLLFIPSFQRMRLVRTSDDISLVFLEYSIAIIGPQLNFQLTKDSTTASEREWEEASKIRCTCSLNCCSLNAVFCLLLCLNICKSNQINRISLALGKFQWTKSRVASIPRFPRNTAEHAAAARLPVTQHIPACVFVCGWERERVRLCGTAESRCGRRWCTGDRRTYSNDSGDGDGAYVTHGELLHLALNSRWCWRRGRDISRFRCRCCCCCR